MHVWETASGRLLKSWPAHYKAVTALAFTDDDSLLLSCSEDTVVHTWSLLVVLDAFAEDTAPPVPMYSWAMHTLPVSGLHVGAGGGTALVATCSADRTARLWTLAQGALLRTVVLPAAASAVVVDPTDSLLCVGATSGAIFLRALNVAPEAAGSHAAATERTLDGHRQAITALAFTLNGKNLASGAVHPPACRPPSLGP